MACIHYRTENHLLGLDDRMPFAEPGVEPHYGPDRTVTIDHIDVRLTLDPVARSFSGESRIRFRPLPAHSGTLSLDLDEVTVDGVTNGEGAALDWSHDDAELRVRDVREAGVIVVRWHGSHPRRGLFFTGPTEREPKRQHMAWTQCQDEDAHFLMPCQDHPGIKHAWSIELRGPKGYTLLSNGVPLEQGEIEGGVFARYEQREPMPAYLFTAVCAQLSVREDRWRDRPVRYFVPVGEEEAIERSMGQTPKMMELFSQKTGVDYPWPRYDQVVVHDFIFGGMENTSCTTMTRLLLVDEKAAVEWEPDGLVAHELAHQWFGDLVTCQDWSQGWLNESWATFMEVVWYEASRSEAEAIWYRHELARQYFEEESGRYRRPIVSYDFREPIDVFDRHLYEKGSCVLLTLRTELGEEPFWMGVRAYLKQHGGGSVHTRDFQRALEQTTGRNLDRFFQQWVHSPGHPELDVKLGREENLVTVAVKQTQSGDGVPEAFHVPLRLEIVFTSGKRQPVVLPVRERERAWAIPTTEEVATVRVDPGFRILARLKLSGPRGWLEALLKDECPVLAMRAAHALVDEGSAGAWKAVVQAMGAHPFDHVRGAIAAMIGKRGGTDARDALIARYPQEQAPRARRRLLDALGNFRDTVTADFLLDVLAGEHPSWHHHGAALMALGKTRDPRAAKAISKHLDVRSWGDWVSQRALEALAETRDEAVLDTLIAYSRPGQMPRTRAAAARAMGRLGDRVEKLRTPVVERLCEMLAEPGFRGQLGAIGALAETKDERALGPLSIVHRTAPDGRTRRSAYESMALIRKGRTSEEALSSLRKRLDALAEENHQLRQRIDKIEDTSKS